MIPEGFKPLVMRITETEGRALPHHGAPPGGSVFFLGAGLDVDTRASWTTYWAYGVPEREVEAECEVRCTGALAKTLNSSGLQ